MTPAKLILEPARATGGMLHLAANLIEPDGSLERLWWEVPEAWGGAITPWADPWVVGFLFPIMQRARPVHVEGRVSPSLLGNLDLFMRIWRIWAMGPYSVVTITADEEIELPPVRDPGLTISSFSCGVDSSFTVYRHARGLVDRRSRRLAAGVMQHGFNVPLDQINAQGIQKNLLAGANTMLGSLELPCISLVTNFRQMKMNWAHSWGTQLVSGLSLLAGRYDTALVANDLPYAWLGIPWPIHPVTTVLLGSKGFSVIDDGGEFSRAGKAKVISQWPEAMQHLQVCFGLDIPGSHENCCRCEKCTRTMLAFRVAECPRPAAFKDDVSDRQIRRTRWNLPTRTLRWQELARGAEAAGLGKTSWAKAIRSAVRRNQWRFFRNRLQRPFIPVRNRIRGWVRGSELSRRQLAAHEPAENQRASRDS